MDDSEIKHKVNVLWAKGYNPIHIAGNLYLVRHQPTYVSRWPLYLFKIIKN